MCELETYNNLSSFNIQFDNSEIDENKKIDLILIVINEYGLKDSTSHSFIFENQSPVIDFKIIPNRQSETVTFDLSNSTDAFGGKDLFLKLDTNDNGTWNFERDYEHDTSFIITTGGFSKNATTKITAQIEDGYGNKSTATRSIRLEHGIIVIID